MTPTQDFGNCQLPYFLTNRTLKPIFLNIEAIFDPL